MVPIPQRIQWVVGELPLDLMPYFVDELCTSNVRNAKRVSRIPVMCGTGLGQSQLQALRLAEEANMRQLEVGFIFEPLGLDMFLDGKYSTVSTGNMSQRGLDHLYEKTRGCPAVVVATPLHIRTGEGVKELLAKAFKGRGDPPVTIFTPNYQPPVSGEMYDVPGAVTRLFEVIQGKS
ncbi:MAG: hypothetical protein V1875_10140 [Candidatus Altiarchaeota archaeon]